LTTFLSGITLFGTPAELFQRGKICINLTLGIYKFA